MVDCSIRIDDNSLSRYHCIFQFENQWALVDGDGEKQSTNGTWLFAENFMELYDQMVFKVGETLFKIQTNDDFYNNKA